MNRLVAGIITSSETRNIFAVTAVAMLNTDEAKVTQIGPSIMVMNHFLQLWKLAGFSYCCVSN
jgi:hypothetical protein